MMAIPVSSLFTRLDALVGLNADEGQRLLAAERQARTAPARRETPGETSTPGEWRGVVEGWAYRQRILIDGRRQVLGFLLPGDLIAPPAPRIAAGSVGTVAVTEVRTCTLPNGSGFAAAAALHAALDHQYCEAHVTRIGRMSSYERIVDWLLEIGDRLALAGGDPSCFRMPVTQELLADALGLTSVHVNRMLQAIRQDGLLTLRAGEVTLPDRARLAALVDHRPAFVPAAAPLSNRG